MRRPRPRVARGDDGISIVLVALSLVVLLVVAAIVVDLGHERIMRREAQSISDLTALAAAQAMSKPLGADPVAGCQEALEYTASNSDALPAGATLVCSGLTSGLTINSDGLPECDGSTPRREVTDGGTAAPYHISVVWPVPNSEIEDATITDSQGLREFDGHQANDQCDRIAVEIGIDHNAFFSGVVRSTDLEAGAKAVARRLPYSDTRTPNLWLLEPRGCDVLDVSGGPNLEVGTTAASGLITIDSSGDGTAGGPGSCSNSNDYVLNQGGGSQIDARPNGESGNPNALDPPGEISMVAFAQGQTGCVSSATGGNVNACPKSAVDSGNIDPDPQRRPLRATRAPVDWFYNCKTGYPDYGSAHGASVTIQDCPYSSERGAYLDLLHDWVNDTSHPAGGWSEYGDDPGEPCTVQSSNEIFVDGNVYVSCNKLSVKGLIAFTGGNVIAAGAIEVSGSGALVVNSDVRDGSGNVVIGSDGNPVLQGSTASPTLPSSDCTAGSGLLKTCFKHSAAEAAYLYQLTGAFKMTGGYFGVNHAAYIQKTTPGNVAAANGGNLEWSPPTSGPFLSLALWSETKSPKYALAGNGTVDLEGVFFTPEANAMSLAGGGALNPQAAQFISRRLKITGNADLLLVPLGIQLIEIPPPAAVLIR